MLVEMMQADVFGDSGIEDRGRFGVTAEGGPDLGSGDVFGEIHE